MPNLGCRGVGGSRFPEIVSYPKQTPWHVGWWCHPPACQYPYCYQNSRITEDVQVGSLEPPPLHNPDSASNLGSKHLSGTRFSSESDIKTVAENWLNGQDVISAKPG
ncbi:hypothetical protein AVEN_214236-1 [Araneus ventricosus]|uniref:Uncharacterized protein n=1 Tax=Araneus ventricosus TaxID=182803 RepID=A0A4Y2WML3_ARAVE|nr:hypothetical protein AVEN_214236-1 [Araneus ventricosus]